MVDFVAPGLLGSLKNFKVKFINPINAATTKDASESDAEVMKRKASILWKQLDMVMNRQNFSILSNILPEKKEYVFFLRMSKHQIELYSRYMELRGNRNMLPRGQAFKDEHCLFRIGAFPYLVTHKKSSGSDEWWKEYLTRNNITEKSFETGNKFVFVQHLLKWFETIGEKTYVSFNVLF